MALRIVDEEGAEALSMSVLAERLGSGTATLYFKRTGSTTGSQPTLYGRPVLSVPLRGAKPVR